MIIKGIFSGLGSLIVAFFIGECVPSFIWILSALVLGFISYGLSINFYIMAQKDLGVAKTSAYYSVSPFLGVAFSMLFIGERPTWQFYIALFIMILSTIIMVKDTIELQLQHTHEHEHIHTHEHSHGDLVHTHEHSHKHTHIHTHYKDEEQHTHRHISLENHDHVYFINV